MPHQPHKDTQERATRELRLSVCITDSYIFHIPPPLGIISSFHHAGRQIEVGQRALLLRQTERMAALHVDGQATGLDEDGRNPAALRTQELLRLAQIMVDVRRRPEQHLAHEGRRVA